MRITFWISYKIFLTQFIGIYINYLIYLLCSSCTHDITWDEYKVEKPSCGRIGTFDISLMGEEIRVRWDPDHTIVIRLRKIDSCSNTEEASNDDRDKNSLPWVCAHKNSNPESKNIKIRKIIQLQFTSCYTFTLNYIKKMFLPPMNWV